MFRTFEYLAAVPTTNDYLKDFVSERKPRMVATRLQTAGKGRHGRQWITGRDEALLVSYLLFPDFQADQAFRFNQLAALATVDAIRELGGSALPISIKVPNDVLIAGRKVSGILTELSTQCDRILWAILGIGVNLRQRGFPPEIERKATSLRLQGLGDIAPLTFCGRLTARIETYWNWMDQGRLKDLDRRFDSEDVVGEYPAI